MQDILFSRDDASKHLPLGLIVFINLLALALAVFHIVNAYHPLVADNERNMIHYAGFAFLAALTYPLFKKNKARSYFLDLIFGSLVALCVAYFYITQNHVYEAQAAQQPLFSTLGWLLGIILLLSTIELTRRTTGWVIPILIIIALSYVTWLGPKLPGVFAFKGLANDTVLFRSIYGDNALFGSIATISSTYVFLFIIFGAFLIRSGAGDFVVDLARGVAGRFIGGPGWVAVIASGLTGTISGSAIANTASTGVITIPLMKRAGFPAKFSAAVEASASTGGQIMPPIMGAGAFVMSSYTSIQYQYIVLVAFLPAILYFLSVGIFVRIEAKRQGLTTITENNSKPLWQAVRDQGASFIIPIALLIFLLARGFSPSYAAVIGIASIIVSSWMTKTKMGIKSIILALIDGSKAMVMMGVLLCAVGLIINVITTTGIGTTFSLMINNWAHGNMVIAIILVALASLVLGMGLPVTAAYIVLATLSAPALAGMLVDQQLIHLIATHQLPDSIQPLLMLAGPDVVAKLQGTMPIAEATALLHQMPDQLLFTLREHGVSASVATTALLSAHMIIFWLSQDSNVTPPVCLASFTAATIAKSPPMATGFESWKLAKGMYIMPILFAYTPLLSGDWIAAFEVFFFAIFGIYAFAAAFQGGMERPVNWLYRLLSAAAGIALLWPDNRIRIPGLVVFVILFALQYKLFQEPEKVTQNLT